MAPHPFSPHPDAGGAAAPHPFSPHIDAGGGQPEEPHDEGASVIIGGATWVVGAT